MTQKPKLPLLPVAQLNYAAEAVADANAFLEASKEKLKKWTGQLAAGTIDKEMFAQLVNDLQLVG